MSIIDSQREQIIRENNTAQEELEGIISNLNPTTKQLVFSTALHGDLDLGILTRRGFRNIEEIILEKGEVTSITNIPQSVLKLHCANQLLMDLFDLPIFIKEVNCDYNYLRTFSGKGLKHLHTLHISHNRLENLDELSKDLEELYCTNNKLKLLNLDGLINLRVLHVSENPAVTIENVPEGLIEFKSDNSPFAIITYDEQGQPKNKDIEKMKHNQSETRMDYLEALNIFFKLKKTYDEKLLKTKRDVFRSAKTKSAGKKAVSKIKPKCINCNRPVGTIFEHKDDLYTAICGATDLSSKCNLNIQLYSGFFFDNETLAYIYKQNVDGYKEAIVKQKLDTLFNYITDQKAAKLFKDALEQYNVESIMYREVLDNLNEKYYSKTRRDLINKKTIEINTLLAQYSAILEDYKQNSENQELLRDAVRLHIREIAPEIENLRRLKYELTEVDTEIKTIVKTYDIKSTLVQRTVNLSSIDEMLGEPQRVVKFSKKA